MDVQLERMEEAAAQGAKSTAIIFSVYDLLWDSETSWVLNPQGVKEYQTLVEKAVSLDLRILGSSTTWVFPPSAEAPLKPESKFAEFLEVPERRVACVPPFESKEYRRLVGLRNRMWESLARQFPEIDQWMVGFEPGFELYECDGAALSLDRTVRYAVDTLAELKRTLAAVDSDDTVVAHFLGESDVPIVLDDRVVQPAEILKRLREEIDRRGWSASDCFDQSVGELDPSLLADRFPEEPLPLLDSTCLVCSKEYCTSTAPWSCPGWNVKCCEDFEVATSNLVASYWEWEEWFSPANQPAVPVAGGWAKPRLVPTHSLGGAESHPNLDIVHDAEFRTQGTERRKWTAVQDFKRAGIPQPIDYAHTGVFIRMQDMPTWAPYNPTRFGCTVYADGTGKLQFTGDDKSKDPGTQGKTVLYPFSVNPNPFDSSKTFRVQIIEHEYFDVTGWKLRWRAEVWDEDGQLIGYRDWVNENTLYNLKGIRIPALAGSKLGFGVTGDSNGIDVQRTGTAYWAY